MAKQRLGKRKHKRCECITGRKYDACFVRGGHKHYVATCISEEYHKGLKYDRVNYETIEFELDVQTVVLPTAVSRSDIYAGNTNNEHRMDHINKKIKELYGNSNS